MSDTALVRLVLGGELPAHALEERLGDLTRAVKVRREVLSADLYPEYYNIVLFRINLSTYDCFVLDLI